MNSQQPDRMPVLVLSGFLGAGKTTFLNQLLSTPVLQDSLVLVNEFGDQGLDGLFLEEAAQATGSGLLIEELTSGCLCCTLQGPLVTTLEDLLRARDNGRIAPFKQLIIETTGLADPAPILGAFAKHPYLQMRYLVGGIITLVDTAQDPSTLDASPEAVAQIAVADHLLLSKTDLSDEVTQTRLERDLRLRNPHAPIATTQERLAQTDWLVDLLAQASPFAPMAEDVHHDHGHNHGHSHDHDHHGDDHHHDHQHAYSTVVTTKTPLEQRIITMFMDLLGMNMPGDLLRIKGLVWITGSEPTEPPSTSVWAVHAAGPLQHPSRPIDPVIAAKLTPNHSQLVVITRTDQQKRVEEVFEACLKQNRVGSVR